MAVENKYLKQQYNLSPYKIAGSVYVEQIENRVPYSVYKFGKNPGVGTAERLIWDGGTTVYVLQSTAQTATIVSTSTADDLAGTGAQKVTIIGLDGNYNPVSAEVDMDGTTPVITTGVTFLRIYRAYLSQSGAGNTNAGTITVTATDTTNVQAIIIIGNGQTLMALDTVPAGFTAYITGLFATSGEGKAVTYNIYRGQEDGTKRIASSFEVVATVLSLNLDTPIRINEKTDIIVQGIGGAAGTVATASLDITFIPDGYLEAL